MDWLSRFFFPNQPEEFRRKQLRQLLLVGGVVLVLCGAIGIAVLRYSRVHAL